MNVYLMQLYSNFWSLSYARTISGRDITAHHKRNDTGGGRFSFQMHHLVGA